MGTCPGEGAQERTWGTWAVLTVEGLAASLPASSMRVSAGPTHCAVGGVSLPVPFRIRVNVSSDTVPGLSKGSLLQGRRQCRRTGLASWLARRQYVASQSLSLLQFPHLRTPRGLSGRKEIRERISKRPAETFRAFLSSSPPRPALPSACQSLCPQPPPPPSAH